MKPSPAQIEPISPAEKRGLRFAIIATLLLTALVLCGTVPDNGFLRLAGEANLLASLRPFLNGIVALIFVFLNTMVDIAYAVIDPRLRSAK